MKKIKLLGTAIILAVIILASCQPKVDLNKEQEDIIKYLDDAKKALIEKNSDLWVSLYADNCVYPSKGEIVHYVRDSIRKNIEQSFNNKNYKLVSIDDLEKPIIYISNDATMAWYIVKSKFNYTLKDSTGNEKAYSSQNSSLFVLEKKDSKWVEVTGVSTFKPRK